MDLPFLNVILLPKPLSVELQNALSTNMLFHIVLLLPKELTPQLQKCDSGPTVMEPTGLTTFPTTLKQLV